jgi:hypothetical protein
MPTESRISKIKKPVPLFFFHGFFLLHPGRYGPDGVVRIPDFQKWDMIP